MMINERYLICSLIVICGAMILGCDGNKRTATQDLKQTATLVLTCSKSDPADLNLPTYVYINGVEFGKIPGKNTKSARFIPKAGLNIIELRFPYPGKPYGPTTQHNAEWKHEFIIKSQEVYSVDFSVKFDIANSHNGWDLYFITINSCSDSDKPPAADVLKAAEAAKNLEELNTQLLAFTKEHVPELHAAIEQIDQDWKDREVRCDKLVADLRRLSRDPATDPDLQRWRTVISEMKEHLVELRKQREEAYIAFKKFELAPSGKSEYERKLRLAKQAATESQDYHKKMQARLENK